MSAPARAREPVCYRLQELRDSIGAWRQSALIAELRKTAGTADGRLMLNKLTNDMTVQLLRAERRLLDKYGA